MSDVSLYPWNEQALKGVSRVLRLEYKITAAKTVSPQPMSTLSLTTFDAFASQSVIDTFLGTTNEFLLAAFDATAMGADTFGGLVNMNGQAKTLTALNARAYSGTGGATLVERYVPSSTALTASTLVTEAAVGSSGNLAFKVDFGNTPDFDALTSGSIIIELMWISK